MSIRSDEGRLDAGFALSVIEAVRDMGSESKIRPSPEQVYLNGPAPIVIRASNLWRPASRVRLPPGTQVSRV